MKALGRRTRVAVAGGLAVGIATLDVALPSQHLAYALIVPLILFARAYGVRAGMLAAASAALAIGALERHAFGTMFSGAALMDATLLAAVWITVVFVVERYEDVLLRSYTTATERLAAENDTRLRDLAERLPAAVRAEEARERERDLAAIADAIPQLVWRARGDGIAEYFNAAWRAYTGWEAAELQARGADAAVHPADLETVRARWSDAYEHGTVFDCEMRLRRFDGAYRWFLSRAIPLRGPDGEIERWFGTCTDIEEQKRMQAQLERRFEVARHVSETFQEASLPTSLPAVAGVTFSATYRAGRREAAVGGDWYDALRLIDGRLVVSIGDVSGSGLAAAITMSAMRQAMRGAAQIHADPVAILEAADRTLREQQPEGIVTAFVGVYDPVTRGFAFAGAGHPPPLLRRPNGEIVELAAPGLPLGVRRKGDTEARDVAIERGAFVALYTDGLIEATHDLMVGERRLRETLATIDASHGSHAADRIAGAVLGGAASDDVAILTLAFDNSPFDERCRRWRFDACDRFAARETQAAISGALVAVGASDAQVVEAELIYAELLGNVVRHARGPCEIVLDTAGSAPVLSVLDRGPGFSLAAFLPTDTLAESGRGLYIVRSLAVEFHAARRPDGGSHARAVLAARCLPLARLPDSPLAAAL